MKNHRHIPLLSLCFLLFLLLIPYGASVHAEEPDVQKELDGLRPEDTEFDHYAEDDRIAPYASSLTGELNHIVIFIRFAGENEYITQEKVNNAEKVYNQGELSLKEYMGRLSYQSININTTFYPKDSSGSYYSVQVDKPADYYKKQYTNNGTLTEGYTSETERKKREEQLIVEVMGKVQEQLKAVASDLDMDNDSFIDAISFIVPVQNPNTEHVAHGDLLWSHKSDFGTETTSFVNGLHIRSYNLLHRGSDSIGILGSSGTLSGTVKHEFLHTLSLPDLYRYSGSAVPLGPWDIMDQGNAANLTAWYQREYLEFGDRLPIYTASKTGITLQAAQYKDPQEIYAVILRSPRNSGEYFVVEYRNQETECTAQLNSGLLVYRITDYGTTGPSPARGNGDGPPDFIYAFRPNETAANAGDGDIGYATLSPDNPRGFTFLGKPLGEESPGYDNQILYYQDGSNSGIVVDNLVKNKDGSMTFDITIPEAIKGNGTAGSPYELYTVQDLSALSSAASGSYYKLMNNLVMGGSNFLPIDSFKGILDGNNKTIRNLNVSDKGNTGFVKTLETGAAVKNLCFENPQITASSSLAGVFADVQGTLENITVQGGTIAIASTATFSSCAGGLVGRLNDTGRISGCYTSAAVSACHAGGLVSYFCGGTITDSYSCGKISSQSSPMITSVTGGTFAYWEQAKGGTIQNTYWDVQASGQSENGLIYGTSDQASFPGCCGIRMDCPDSIRQGETAAAKIVSTNGSSSLKASWESSDPNVITVNASTGSLSCKKGGTATISCRFTIGSQTAALSRTITCQGSDSGSSDNDDSDNTGSGSGNSGNTGSGSGSSGNTGSGSGNSGNTGSGSGNSGNTGSGSGSSGNTGSGSGNSGNTGSGNGNSGSGSSGNAGSGNGSSGNTGSGSGNSGNTGSGSGSSGNTGSGSGNSGNTGSGSNVNETSGSGTAIPVLNGSWIASGNSWWFRNADGSYPANGIYSINGSNFAFDSSGWMITGWYFTNGYWYYFDTNGYMHLGWLHLGNTWYYLNPSNGQMYAGGIYSIDNSRFAFQGSGAMVTGWYYTDGCWYYFNGSGYIYTGWLHLGSTWYYLNPSNGQMYAGGIHSIDNSRFAFQDSGAMITGWYYTDGCWYYFNGSGYIHTGWLQLGNIWYYLDPSSGQMYADCTVQIDGRNSSFRPDGAWLGYAD